MKAAVARHEQVVNDAIVSHGGYVFKVLGDAFCAAFKSATAAVAAACDAQRALAAEDFSSVGGLSVRMGLHAGSAQERGADYFGPTVNRVARLMSIGHGGQVLISGIVLDLIRNDLPSGAVLTDLGLRRLKDLTQPERVWQVSLVGLRSEFPPLNSIDGRANNLPIQVTSLVGREHDLDIVKMLLDSHRLLTISGAGGVGKTRLALQVGADLLDRYPDGVWFADLGPIGDSELVASVIAKTVGLTQVGGQRVDEAIPEWLKRKKLLLILDNCEHMLDNVARIADAIIHNCPDVQLLSTSRQALRIGGEEVFRLPSLDVPQTLAGLTPDEILRYGAVTLFVDRARSVDQSFKLDDDTVPIVADICRRLDGIPLAIELAAARVNVLSIPTLAQRLDERFRLLTGGNRTALPRQKTLGALIDWSYALLTQREQTLFNRLGVFAGGFSLDAATDICGNDELDEIDVLDLLSSLSDKSLVTADTSGEQERYRLLESTRAYALDKLDATGERDRLARIHAEYYRARAQAADKRFGAGSSIAWLASVEPDLDNFRSVLEWALIDGNDVTLGSTVAGALDRAFRYAGLIVEERYWIDRALASLDESAHPEVAARLWRALASFSAGKQKCENSLRALALCEAAGDRHESAWARVHFAWGLHQTGRLDEADLAKDEALALMREFGDKLGELECLDVEASVYLGRGELAAARDAFVRAIEMSKDIEHHAGTGAMLINLAEVEFRDGRPFEAQRLASEGTEILSRGKNASILTHCFNNRAAYRIAIGDLDGAREDALAGLRFARQIRSATQIGIAFQHIALLRALRGEASLAAYLLGCSEAQFAKVGFGREYTERWGYEQLMAAVRERLSEAEFAGSVAEGAALSENRAMEEALNGPSWAPPHLRHL